MNPAEEILKKIITKEDLLSFIDKINLAKDWVFKEGEKPLSIKLKGKIESDFLSFLEKLEKNGFLSVNPEKNISFLQNLKSFLQKIPQVKVELAFLPKRDFLEKIYSILEKEVGRKIILDIVFNPEILGGVRLEFGGKYGDFSLLKKFNELEIE